jgi:hypothetical protein
MATFDPTLWKTQARRRLFQREKKRRPDAKLLYGRELGAINGISTVIEWCNQRSIVVDFIQVISGPFADGSYDPQTKIIEINARSRPETQLFYLLHECGHHLIAQCGDKRIRHVTHNQLLNDKRSLVSKIDEIAEEFEAWIRGRKLAERLDIYVNAVRFEQEKAEALATYCRF